MEFLLGRQNLESGMHLGRGYKQMVEFYTQSKIGYFYAPGEIRTPDPLVRSQILYPAELRAHLFLANFLIAGNLKIIGLASQW